MYDRSVEAPNHEEFAGEKDRPEHGVKGGADHESGHGELGPERHVGHRR
jgi:hypothetical protein